MTPSKRHSSLQIADIALTLSLAAALFCLLTNLIPFVQAGWMEPLKSKGRYAQTTRIAFVTFFALLTAFMRFVPDFGRDSNFLNRARSCFEKQTGLCVSLMTLYYFGSAFLVGLTRHQALETRAFDLGIFTQAIWNSLQGEILMSSIKENISLLGDHFQPLQLAAAPLYWLWPAPETLLAIQAFCMTLCIPLIFIYARDVTRSRTAALTLAAAFFLFLPSRGVLHEDYHPEILVQPLLILGFLAYRRQRGWLLAVLLMLILTGKENMAGIVFCAGIYSVWVHRKWRLGSALIVGSVAYFVLITKWVIPFFAGGAEYLYSGNFNDTLAHPLRLAGMLFSGDTLSYIGKLFLPLGFLSFLHPPTLLFCLPVLMQNLLSENEAMRSFNFHYTIGLTPFVFISAAHGWTALNQRFPALNRHAGKLLLIILFLSLMRTGPSEYYYFANSLSNIDAHTERVREKMQELPAEVTVLTHNNLIPQAVNRRFIYQFEYNESPTKAEQALKYGADAVITEERFWEPKSMPPDQTYASLLNAGYRLAFHENTFRIFLKNEQVHSS